MEHRSQSKDRWQNGRQRRAGTPLRSRSDGGASCIDCVGRAKLILLRADVDCAERSLRANIRIHGSVGWVESRRSRPISFASGATLLTRDPDFNVAILAEGDAECFGDGRSLRAPLVAQSREEAACQGVGVGVDVGEGVAPGVAVPAGVGVTIGMGVGVACSPLGSFL